MPDPHHPPEPEELETGAVPTLAEDAAAVERGRAWPWRVAKWIGITLLGLLALVAALLFGLDTGPGHRFISDQIGALKFANGMQIGIGRIEGSIYGRMTLHDLSVRDIKGEFLFSPEVRVDWRPFAYLRNHVDVRSATMKRLVLHRVPEFKPTPPSNAPLLPDLDIDIGRLRIDRFVAEQLVSGEERVLAMDGAAHIADGRAQVRFVGDTVGGQDASGKRRSGGDRVRLLLDASPARDKLEMTLAVDAPKGGVITALAGLKDPLTIRADGAGEWKGWAGRLDADLAGSELARLALRETNGTFTLRGPTRIARLFTGPTARLLGPVMTLNMSAAFARRHATVTGTIASDSFQLTSAGVADLADSRFDDLKLTFDLFRPSALAPNLSAGNLQALLTLNGAFRTPHVDYVITGDRVTMNDMSLLRLVARGAATVDSRHIMVPVDARVARVTGLDAVAGGTIADVRLQGDLAVEGTKLLSDNMHLTSNRIDAKLVLLADTARGLYTGALNGRIDNYRYESVGVFDIDSDIHLKSVAPRGFAMVGKVRARSTRLLNTGLASFLGGDMVAATDVAYGPDGVVRFSRLSVAAPALRVTGGSGSYAPNGRVALTADAVSSRYGRIGVRVTGTIANPDAHITAEHPGLGLGLANLDARITGAPGGYRLAAIASTDYGPLTADVVLLTKGSIALQIDRASLGGIEFAGRVAQTGAGPFAGTLTATGSGLGGIVRLAAQGKYQEALINLRAANVAIPGPAAITIGSAIVDARVVLYDKPYVVADAQLANASYGTTTINAARVLVDYRNGAGQAKALVEGTSAVPFRVAANVAMQPNLWRAMLTGRTRGVDFHTITPARIVPRPGSYELLPTRIDVGTGSLVLAGGYGPGIRVASRLEHLDLTLVNAFAPGMGIGGTASGSVDFAQAGPDAFPHADMRLHIDNFSRTTSVTISQPVDVDAVGRLLPDGASANAVMRTGGAVIGHVVVSLRPLGAGAGTWTARMLAAPLGGGIRYNGPADTLFSFAGQANQRLTGAIGVAADFSCHVSAPCLNGIIKANDLTYENQIYGTKLTGLALSGRFTGDRLDVDRFSAKAGGGTIAGQGYVSLAADAGYPMDVQVTLDKAQLARSDAVSATATGTVRLQKAAGADPLLSGTIKLPETRYQIVRQAAADVPQLTGVRFKTPKTPAHVTGDEPAPATSGFTSKINLDLTVAAPEKLYVSGMGLESEWSASLRLTGSSAAPSLSGQVDLVRGTLGFAGRSFDLDEGKVQFTGGGTIDPTVDISASTDVEDVTITVAVSGRALDPQITFSSSPGLPQDEIVARILFGSSVANLSAIQAIQLATSLNSLRGSGGGLNPLGKLRSVAGIDRLRILGADQTAGRGTAIAAGQYITKNIYVELITDAKGFTATQIEVSLKKWLSLLGQAGGSGQSAGSVRIKKNY